MSLEIQEMLIKGAIEAVLEAQTSRKFILIGAHELWPVQACDEPEQPQHFKME